MNEDARVIILELARALGCTCEPDLRVTESAPGVVETVVAHDDGCPLLRRQRRRRTALN